VLDETSEHQLREGARPRECRIASIGRDHAMILPPDANPKPDGIFGKDNPKIGLFLRWAG
jgi:hypothetical protein